MSNICDFDRILNTECNFQHLTRNCRITNLDDWKRWGKRVFVESRSFKCEGERKDHMLDYQQLFNVFERRENKCCGVLIQHCSKVKGDQVITLQMAQQLKIEANIFRILISLRYLPLVKISKKSEVRATCPGWFNIELPNEEFFPLSNHCYDHCKNIFYPFS